MNQQTRQKTEMLICIWFGTRVTWRNRPVGIPLAVPWPGGSKVEDKVYPTSHCTHANATLVVGRLHGGGRVKPYYGPQQDHL